MLDPKICIVFNGGAAGDFFVSLLSQQIKDYNKKIELDLSGAVISPSGQNFKIAAKQFYKTNFNVNSFEGIKDEPIVSTHYCYQELLDLFPNCQFYYIDDSAYIDITVEVYIKKRVPNLLNWLCDRLKLTDVKKIKQLSDEYIKIIMKNDWKKQSSHWKNLNLQSINLYDILHYDRCLSIIKTILGPNIDVTKFSEEHNKWTTNNEDFINKVLNERL